VPSACARAAVGIGGTSPLTNTGTTGTSWSGVRKCSGTMIEWSISSRSTSARSNPRSIPRAWMALPMPWWDGTTRCSRPGVSSFGPPKCSTAATANVGRLSRKNVLKWSQTNATIASGPASASCSRTMS
jgi:hypothetical protein